MRWKKTKKDVSEELQLWRATSQSLANSIQQLTGLVDDLLDITAREPLDPDEVESFRGKARSIREYAQGIEAEASGIREASLLVDNSYSLKELNRLVQEPPP